MKNQKKLYDYKFENPLSKDDKRRLSYEFMMEKRHTTELLEEENKSQ